MDIVYPFVSRKLINFEKVKWSPFDERRLAIATAQNFGIVGNGKQYIVDFVGGKFHVVNTFYTRDGSVV